MRQFVLLILALCPLLTNAQLSLKKAVSRSWYSYVYKINAADAERYFKQDSVPFQQFATKPALWSGLTEKLELDSFPIGWYLQIQALDNMLNATLHNNSDLLVIPVNDKHRLKLDIRTRQGTFVQDAKVIVKNKTAPFHPASGTYRVPGRKFDEALVRVYTPGDTCFTELWDKEDWHRPIREQRWQNFKRSRFFRTVWWLPSKIKNWIGGAPYKSNRIGASGYILFNQPKYKPLDTVRLKGYVVDRKWHQYKKDIQVYISYYARGEYHNKFISQISTLSDGAYASEFVLADTIPNDVRINLLFRTSKNKEILRNYFSVEDYVLDEMGSFSFSSGSEKYQSGDTLQFKAASKDANGLHVMDATATLYLLTQTVQKIFRDSLIIPDTLAVIEKKLNTTEDTRFELDSRLLPAADLSIKAELVFKNSNNERNSEYQNIEYKYRTDSLSIYQEGPFIRAVLSEDQSPINRDGVLQINDQPPRNIRFPFTEKIDPLATKYIFFYGNTHNGKRQKKSFVPEGNYQVPIRTFTRRDTAGFRISNPWKVPVYYSVLFGKKIIATGKDSSENIEWIYHQPRYRQAFIVRWQYYWQGIEIQKQENIGLRYKLLNIDLKASEQVYPGKKDSLRIQVRDYMGKPAARVNLTALSYNNQFKKDIRVANPPYLARYKARKYLIHENYEADESFYYTSKSIVGKHRNWFPLLHLDTMTWYKLILPKDGFYEELTKVESKSPQIAVHVVNNGMPQEIYLLYINNELVYYNGSTATSPYAFEAPAERVKIGIRLKNRFIELNNVNVSSGFKHDISIDLSRLAKNVVSKRMPTYWTRDEINLLERSIWRRKYQYSYESAYIWQGRRMYSISGYGVLTAGPFKPGEKINYFKPGVFETSFEFEPGNAYTVEKHAVKMEKDPLFAQTKKKNRLPNYKPILRVGDTLIPPVFIEYIPQPAQRSLKASPNSSRHYYYYTNSIGKAQLQFFAKRDSIYSFILLQNQKDDTALVLAADRYDGRYTNFEPGIYNIYLVTNNNYTACLTGVELRANHKTCIGNLKTVFQENHPFIEGQIDRQSKPAVISKEPIKVIVKDFPNNDLYQANGASITGTVKDKKTGQPISGASILIRGYRTGTYTDLNGQYKLGNLRWGRYSLEVSSAGYEMAAIEVNLGTAHQRIDVQMQAASTRLEEVVVVTGYGVARSKLSNTTNIVSSGEVESLLLEGKLSSVTLVGHANYFADSVKFLLRGTRSLKSENQPLYVIDGILYDALPAHIKPEDIIEMNTLDAGTAASLYGSRASNGAVVISTRTKTNRTQFRDYAFWEPNFFTDKKGEAAIEVNYPDNITGWKTYVVGMDKKRRIGKSSILTQSFKPIVSQLGLPQFLLKGDSAKLLGKVTNYTNDTYELKSRYSINGIAKPETHRDVKGKESLAEHLHILANSDTIRVDYANTTTTGFSDAEQKTIPVFEVGTLETNGRFWILEGDSAVTFSPSSTSGKTWVYAQNNTLDLLLNELDQLKRYPYYCMEQIASKLTGYALEKKIREKLGQKFKHANDVSRLIAKLQKSQQMDGGWSWWDNGESDFYVTNYVVQALGSYIDNPLVQTNLRNGQFYLQNELLRKSDGNLVRALYTLSSSNHTLDYENWLKKINYDSLDQHHRWIWVSVAQKTGSSYQERLKQLVEEASPTILGGLHWGVENYRWYSNSIATTVLAFRVLQKEPGYQNLLPQIIQYFLEMRKNSYWRNTVESASIIDAILPSILEKNPSFNQKTELTISGAINTTVKEFPFEASIDKQATQSLQFVKKGGGLLFVTAYEKYFNKQPSAVDSLFKISSWFERNGQRIETVKSGEKTILRVRVDVVKDADYVLIDIPIPGGCIYGNKKNQNWYQTREYYKDRTVLFQSFLSKGTHYFDIELEPRYTGSFTLNPVRAELMYFPTFYGRNEIRKTIID